MSLLSRKPQIFLERVKFKYKSKIIVSLKGLA